MPPKPILSILCFLSALLPLTLPAQAPANTAAATYDVISIHAHDPNDTVRRIMNMGDHFEGANVGIAALIMAAFDVTTETQITGIPPALKDMTWDILAKVDPALAETIDKLPRDDQRAAQSHMMRALLEDRFSLKSHMETRELPVYLLVPAKSGVKLRDADPEHIPNVSKDPDGKFHGGGMLQVQQGAFTAQGIGVSMLATHLQHQVHRIVRDNTGLAGRYDFTLTWNPNPLADNPDTTRPDLFTALEEQLGLKLVAGKAPAQIVVIDHIEAPTPN